MWQFTWEEKQLQNNFDGTLTTGTLNAWSSTMQLGLWVWSPAGLKVVYGVSWWSIVSVTAKVTADFAAAVSELGPLAVQLAEPRSATSADSMPEWKGRQGRTLRRQKREWLSQRLNSKSQTSFKLLPRASWNERLQDRPELAFLLLDY